jgi:hypothetical protein
MACSAALMISWMNQSNRDVHHEPVPVAFYRRSFTVKRAEGDSGLRSVN